jgi:two-component system LytT family response regulator
MIRAIIIDDENKARQLLQAMLGDLCPDVQVDTVCNNLASGIKAIKQFKPDLVFLDIEMPGHNGLQLLDFLVEDEITFDIIFVTAYSDYAINAFKLEAIDYILKPVDADQLVAAVNRCRKSHLADLEKYQLLKHRFSRAHHEKLAISQLEGIRLIEHHKILYLEGDGSYTKIASNTDFFRCHKSFMINTTAVQNIAKGDKPIATINGQEISVSIDKLDQLLELLGINNQAK